MTATRTCPNCGKSTGAGSSECSSCGLIYAKWKTSTPGLHEPKPLSGGSVTLAQAALLAAGILAASAAGYRMIRSSPANSSVAAPSQSGPAGICGPLLRYRIGNVDARTGLDQAAVRRAAQQAASMWETAAGGRLFEYDDAAPWSINVPYDHWVTLQGLEQSNERFALDHDRSEALHREYDQLMTSLKPREEGLRRESADWNAKGGAPPEVYERLQKERVELQQMVDRVNAIAAETGGLSWADTEEDKRVRATVKEFERLGECRPDERVINLYYASDDGDLTRLLAHEMGHALGLGHVASADAIMYPSENKQRELTPADQAALSALCSGRARKPSP